MSKPNIYSWNTSLHYTDPIPASLDILLGIKSRLDEILITGIIQQTSHRVHIVDSGLMALQSLKKQTFDVCLLSYNLADLTGPETAKAIRTSHESWNNIPIIGLLPQAMDLCIADCLQAGMNTILTAPIASHKILCLLRYYQEKIPHYNLHR